MNSNSKNHIASTDSIRMYRYAVYFESEWLLKEANPIRRANAARRLAELSAILAEMEAAEAKQFGDQISSNEVT